MEERIKAQVKDSDPTEVYTSTRQSTSCFVLSPKLILPRPINVQLVFNEGAGLVKGGLIYGSR